ncbi:FAD-dependent oxidoreductase [Thermanaerothrix sp.]|jgi:ferredoxin--NADP+ reductase|uniref:FAD-dependent oxidoreductase n=1 Tax=Thermanaerothrix sp. TaxID=2972675 RepID=UPI003C7AEB87
MSLENRYWVAIAGAGPAGLYAAQHLAENGVQVVLFNRDIRPGGLAEYGIYPDKLRLKNGLRAQFQQILSLPEVHYYGNVRIGREGDFTLDDLRQLGFQAILVAVGAQGTKWLGLPGETLEGVYHAKDIVYHYNKLPPYSQRTYKIGKKVAIVGGGNVMVDVAHYLIDVCRVDEVVAIVRRGPKEVKFDRRELEMVAANLDWDAFEAELERVAPVMRALGQDPETSRELVRNAITKAGPKRSPTRLWIRFLASPRRILDNGQGAVGGIELEDNTLVLQNGEVVAKGLGHTWVMPVDTVIFAIGDRVDETLGLPVHRYEYDKNPHPRFPIEGESYEAYDSERNEPIEGVFVAGWSRKASSGLVGTARKDGVNAARAILSYLATLSPLSESLLPHIEQAIHMLSHPVVTKEHLERLYQAEAERARALGLDDYRFATNEEMLEAMGLLGVAH